MPSTRFFFGMTFALLVVLSAADVQARDTLWTQTYWNGFIDSVNCIRETADSGFILAGGTQLEGRADRDVSLIKTDSLGLVEWSTFIGDATFDEFGFHVLQTVDGGYLVSAQSNIINGIAYGIWLVRTDAEGDTLWTFPWCPDNRSACPYDAVITSTGDYAVTGIVNRANGNFNDAFILVVDDDGVLVDQGFYGDSYFQDGKFITQMADSGFMLAGNFNNSYSTLYDWWVVRTDKDLVSQWDSLYILTDYYDYMRGACRTEDGIAMTGLSRGEGWVHKIDFEGNTVFSKSISIMATAETYSSICTTPEGGFMVGGICSVAGHSRDFCLIKLEPDGDTIWSFTLGGAFDDHGQCLVRTYDDNYVLAGKSTSFFNGECIYVGKVEEGCCRYRVGDANGSGADEPTIGDISIMIDAKFISFDNSILPCFGEADVNLSGGRHPTGDDVTIGDISYLIDYLFISIGLIELPGCM